MAPYPPSRSRSIDWTGKSRTRKIPPAVKNIMWWVHVVVVVMMMMMN